MAFECLDTDSSLFQNDDGNLDVHFVDGSGFETIEGYGGGLALSDLERAPRWAAWSPQWFNLSVGSGRQTAKYMQLDKLVFYSIVLYLASDSSIGAGDIANGGVRFIPPVPAAPNFTSDDFSVANGCPVGQCWMQDVGTANYVGLVTLRNERFYPQVFDTSSFDDVTLKDVVTDVPFTWATGDSISVNGWYKAL